MLFHNLYIPKNSMYFHDLELSGILIAAFTVIIFHLLSTFNAKQRRRAQLVGWVENALIQRKNKCHSCLNNSEKLSQNEIAEKFYSAVETRKLVTTGKINAAENLVRWLKDAGGTEGMIL